MPVPRMPLDLVAYIADFVEYSFSPIDPSASKVTRRTGEALSLVCRSWTRIGRDLRWRTLVLRPSSFASLLEHLTAHPHLAPHVQNIRQAGSIRTVHLDGLSLFVERSPGIAQIDALVSLLAVARWTTRLAFAKDKTEAEQFPQILQAASRLPLLQIFDISSIDYLDWDDDCASAWLDGFPSITDINLDFGPLEDSSSRALHQGDRPLKKLRALWLEWSLETEEEQETWATSFLSTLDPSSLLECEILDDAVSSATWSWLGRCEFLTKLHIATRLDQSEEILTELFRLFPRIQGLRSLDIADYDTDEGDSIEVDLALEQMLASCPPSLSWICVKHILFRDCEAISEIDEGLWEDQEHLAGRGFVRKTEEEYAFWPLRKDRAGQWFRVIEEDDDEDEGASIDNDGGNGRDPDDDQADNAGDKDADEEDDNRQGSIETSRDAAGDDAQGAIRAQVEERDGSARAEM